jgi:hypothetical protein
LNYPQHTYSDKVEAHQIGHDPRLYYHQNAEQDTEDTDLSTVHWD